MTKESKHGDTKCYFTMTDMLKFYLAFDPVKFKYQLDETVEWDRYSRIMEYESSQQFACLTRRDYASDFANLNLVYDESEENLEITSLIDLIFNKVIGEYISIDGLERLFSEKYIEFEWEMHLSADYKKHNMKYYRDHFVHQIRDAFMMHRMLEMFGFYGHIKSVLENESNSKVSRYVQKMLTQQKLSMSQMERELIGDDSEFYLRNLIYMTCYLAGLFHDIGYPEQYYMTTNRHIMDYISDLYNLNTGSGDIWRVYSTLQNSLLFRLVPFAEIERRMNAGKPEHGTLSAIIFLLHFYDNGAIYRLPSYKIAAVELAALAIYNHTNKYEIIDSEKVPDAYRPCFHLNPFSYLLRICDDLQEWERIYFVISNKPNPLICSRCRTPILRKNREKTCEETALYECNCKWASRRCTEKPEAPDCFSQVFDGTSKFPYRRIFNVSVCDKESAELFNNGKILIKLHYNLLKLLHIAYTHPGYAKGRIKELNAVKRLLSEQRSIPMIYLDYFVTANPILIKVKILEEFFRLNINWNIDDDCSVINTYRTSLSSEGEWEKWLNDWFKYQEQERIKNLEPILDQFFVHENLCKECGICENWIHALSELSSEFVMKGYYSCEREAYRRCLSWAILKGKKISELTMEEIKKLIMDNHNLCTMMEEKKLSLPDFHSMVMEVQQMGNQENSGRVNGAIDETEKTNVSIFFDENKHSLWEAADKIPEVCPIRSMRSYMSIAVQLYVELYLCLRLSEWNNSNDIEAVKFFVKKKGKELSNKYTKYPEMRYLIEDCFLQFSRMYEDVIAMQFFEEKYFNQFSDGERHKKLYSEEGYIRESDGYLYTAVTRYTDPEAYKPILEKIQSKFYSFKNDTFIDAYTDLYFFRLLGVELERAGNKD